MNWIEMILKLYVTIIDGLLILFSGVGLVKTRSGLEKFSFAMLILAFLASLFFMWF